MKNENVAKIFEELVRTFLEIVQNNDKTIYVNSFKKANDLGMIDFNKSVVGNLHTFLMNAELAIKETEDFKKAIEDYQKLLNYIANSNDLEIRSDFCDKRLIYFFLERLEYPYNETALGKLLFNKNYNANIDLLHEQIRNFLEGSSDLRIINSLDSTSIDPVVLQNDQLYNEMIDFLINKYLKDYNKVNKTKIDDYIIRLLYRHLNRGYYIPTMEMKRVIVNRYAFNCWFKELKLMIEKNKLLINADEAMELANEITCGIEERDSITDLSRGEYMDIHDKVVDLIARMYEVAEDNQKLVRKVEE